MRSVTRAEPHDQIGTELVREWVPAGEPRAVVILVHGMAEHSGRYERTGDLLSEAGFHVRSFDMIGHGGSGGARVDIDDWNRFHDQVHDHMEWAHERGRPVVLMGHSLGSLLAVGYCLENRHQPRLMVLTAPTFGGGAAWQRILSSVLSRVLPTVSIPHRFDAFISSDPAVGERYVADPLVHPKATLRIGHALFEAMDRAKEGVGSLTVPTLALHGGDDRLVPTHTSAFIADLPTVERRVYPGLHHEILNEPEGPEVVADIVAWINDRI